MGDTALPLAPSARGRDRGLTLPLRLSGIALTISSGYLLFGGCPACTESQTGMPLVYARVLALVALGFGVGITTLAGPARLRLLVLILVLSDLAGIALLLGVISGVYRACPACIAGWSAIAVANLTVVAHNSRESRLILAVLFTLVLAGSWVRIDRTTSLGLAEILPRVGLARDCISDVLTASDMRELAALKVPDRVPLIFVAHCSPCAAATIARYLQKHTSACVVAPDASLAPVVGSNRLIVLPALQARAAKLQANLYELILVDGSVSQCNANVSSMY